MPEKSRLTSTLRECFSRIEVPRWYAVFFLAAILVFLDVMGRSLMGGGLETFRGTHLTYAFSLATVTLLIWVLPFWIVLDLIPRKQGKNLLFLFLLVVFSFSWQSSALQGEGVRGHPLFRAIQFVFVFSFAGGVLGWTAFLTSSFPKKLKWFFVFAITCFLMTFDYYYFPEYTAFHGHLSLFNACSILYLFYPALSRDTRRIGAAVLGFLSVVSLVTAWPEKRLALKYVKGRNSVVNGLLDAFPEIAPLTLEFPDIIDPSRPLPEGMEAELEQKYREGLEVYRAPKQNVARNILVIVLESTRADHWADPALAPRFHEWRRHGVYFREAISQYSATPLAYGAMFTGQSPSVMIHSPFWSRIKPFWDRIGINLDRHILSKPDDRWFDRNTITDFLVPKGTEINKHGNARQGVAYLKSRLATVAPGQTFLAWVHLYEPHASYVSHDGFDFGDGAANAYKSEVAYMDHWLGDFMDWFYNSPYARDTLTIVFSDHGEGMGELVDGRGFWRHNRIVRNFLALVPAYFSGPGFPENEMITEGYVGQVNVLPSIFYAMDQVPEDYYFQGIPVQRILAGEPVSYAVMEDFSYRHEGGRNVFDLIDEISGLSVEESLALFSKLNENQSKFSHRIGWFENGYKLIYNRVSDRYRLYDMRNDKGEQNDLADTEPERLAAIKESLRQWTLEQCWLTRKMNEKLAERIETEEKTGKN